jgi:hypothetical protein
MTCSSCTGDYEDPDRTAEPTAEEYARIWDLLEDQAQEEKHEHSKKDWRASGSHPWPQTYFATYHSRLHALAERHGVPVAAFKALIEDAFGKCDTPPAEQESKQALLKLAKMRVGPCEINWLFQYHIVREML